MEKKMIVGKQYKRNNVTYTVIKVDETPNATYITMSKPNGKTVAVGKAILKKDYKEIK